MIRSIDKKIDKSQYPFMIKTQQISNRRALFNQMKDSCEKPPSNMLMVKN